MNARTLLAEIIRLRNTPSGAEQDKFRQVAPGAKVLIYREKVGWTPNTLVRARKSEVDGILSIRPISALAASMGLELFTRDVTKAFV